MKDRQVSDTLINSSVNNFHINFKAIIMSNNFDPELITYYERLKERLKTEHIGYLKDHPEIKHILSDFITKLLLHKPEDTY
jgi:hypothetical protein